MKMTRVVALERGHDGRAVREKDEEFDLDLEDKRFQGCTWFVSVEKAPAPKKADAKARPPGAGPAKGSAPPEITPGDIA